jgi:hypothetical protein
MRLHDRSLSKISLLDTLKRRRTNLKKYLSDAGIVTYELLVKRCESMGLIPPTEEEFEKSSGTNSMKISSPSEGIVVLDPPRLTEEHSGKHLEIQEGDHPQIEVQVITTSEETKTKKQKKSTA